MIPFSLQSTIIMKRLIKIKFEKKKKLMLKFINQKIPGDHSLKNDVAYEPTEVNFCFQSVN